MKETKNIEYKSEVTNTFLKTVSAYANFGPGVIKFGVSEDGEFRGIDNPEQKCLDIENKINDSIRPKPDYSLSIDSNNIITLSVTEGRYKPYLYKGKAYRRSDTATIGVDEVELRRLNLEGANLNYEELADEEDKTFDYLESRLIQRLGISALSEDMLRTFGFYTKDKQYNIASALMSDKNRFPGIDMVRFGDSINDIRDRRTAAGVSVMEQYDSAVVMFKRYYQYETIEGFDRIEKELIPETAFRETVANALVHRTWDVNIHIRIEMYKDKIVVVSPGGLPCGLSPEEYLRGNISCLRNPIIGSMFFRMHYIEMFGTGIRRIKDSYKDFALKPSFEIYENSIKTILPVITEIPYTTTEGALVLSLFYDGTRILTAKEIATELNWSKAKTIRTLNSLISSGYLIKTGNGRGTKYCKV